MKYVRCDSHCKYPAYDKEEIDNLFYKKNDFAVLTGQIVMTNNTGTIEVNYPEGFTRGNCVVLSYGLSRESGSGTTGNVSFGYGINTVDFVRGSLTRNVSLKDSNIEISVFNPVSENTTEYTYNYKVVLMKY
jgi:hypothetical protein